MKRPIALITDSASNLPAAVAQELGIRVVAGSFAFADERLGDEPQAMAGMYRRMSASSQAPRTFGPTEAAWTRAFRDGLNEADAVVCLVTPFDVSSSFTTASAAMLAIQFDQTEARIKIVNPGVGSAGLASLLVALANVVAARSDLDDFLETLESIEPACDSLFVPADMDWLRRSGRLALIEERLGELDDAYPVLRVGTRITGVARAESHEEAMECAVRLVGQRAGPESPLAITVAHAGAPATAQRVAKLACAAYRDSSIATTELASAIGAQLGPGAIGIGAAPRTVGKG